MEKEEFAKKKMELQDALYKLQEDYIKANSPIPIDTKVKITIVDWDEEESVVYGFIESYYLAVDEVYPSILAVKKDGKPSTKHVYIPRIKRAKFEVCNE